MTRPWRKRGWKQLSKPKVGELAAAAADQRNLTGKASIADIATIVENDRRESVTKLAESTKSEHAILHKILQL
jgi:hypothetical protein